MKLIFDFGTTNIKYHCYDKENKLIYKNEISNHQVYFEKDNRFNPNKLLEFVENLIHKFIRKYNTNLEIGFSSAMHSLILLDQNNNLLTPGFTLLDSLSELKNDYNQDFHAENGLISGSFLPIYKLKNGLIDEYKTKLKKITSLKGYLLNRLTGQEYLEISDAAGFGLINLDSRKYDKKILDYLELNETFLPKILNEVTEFKCTKFEKPVTIFLGSSDGAASAYYASSLNSQTLSLSIGTTLGLRKLVDHKPKLKNDNIYIFPVYDQSYICGISFSNGANNLQYALEKRDLDFNYLQKLSKIDINKLYSEKISFFPERGFTQQTLAKIEDYPDTDKLIKTIIYQLAQKIKTTWNMLDEELMQHSKIICTGGIFKSSYIKNFFNSFFTGDLVFSNSNLSIEGVLSLMVKKKDFA